MTVLYEQRAKRLRFAPTQLSRPRAVTPFAVNGEGMQEQKPRQPCGRESSFSPNAISGHRSLRSLVRLSRRWFPEGTATSSLAQNARDVAYQPGFPADAQMPTAWALREPGAALGEICHHLIWGKNMLSKTYELKLQRLGRAFGGYEHPITDSHLSVFTDAVIILSNFYLPFEQSFIELSINWDPFIRAIKKHIEVNNCSSIEELEKKGKEYEKVNSPVLMIDVKVKDGEESQILLLTEYVHNFIFHLFLIMNLSAPASFSLHDSKLNDSSINLCTDDLETAWIESLKNNWPSIQYVPLKDTWEWYKKLKLNKKQIAETRTERAIFALLHFCSSSSDNPANLIWLAHALESLYDTPANAISKTLRDRIFVFLGQPQNNYRTLKKKINQFYEFRSAFVHGTLDIYCPACSECLDEKIESHLPKFWVTYDFALSLTIATLQQMIIKQWTTLYFSETVSGQ